MLDNFDAADEAESWTVLVLVVRDVEGFCWASFHYCYYCYCFYSKGIHHQLIGRKNKGNINETKTLPTLSSFTIYGDIVP